MIETLTPGLRRSVSRYTGIVRTLDECLAAPADPPLYRATCEVSDDAAILGSPLGHLAGTGGSGVTRAEAARAAVGEALERYSASYVPRERLMVATAAELGPTAVDPARFALFSAQQLAARGFPFRRFTDETRVAWVEGTALPAGGAIWLPAEFVFLGDANVGEPIGYATSSGTACGETREETLARGLFELLERDAFMITWSARLELPLLDWSGDLAMCELDRHFFRPTGLSYAAVDLSSIHGIPSVLGVVRAPDTLKGTLGVGAGTSATVEQAWLKALSEAFASRSAGAKLLLLDDHEYGPLGEGVNTFEDHIRFYADAGRARAAAFLDASTERTPVATIAGLEGDLVATLSARIGLAGSTAFAVDVTAPDVADLGLVVTKVVAPELCALDVAHGARFLGGSRLAGFAGTGDVNPYPHPFP